MSMGHGTLLMRGSSKLLHNRLQLHGTLQPRHMMIPTYLLYLIRADRITCQHGLRAERAYNLTGTGSALWG